MLKPQNLAHSPCPSACHLQTDYIVKQIADYLFLSFPSLLFLFFSLSCFFFVLLSFLLFFFYFVSSSILVCLFFLLSSRFISPTPFSLYYFSSHTSSSSSPSTSLSVTSQALIDLFWPRLIVSSKVFQVAFVHFVHKSTLLAFSCCSFSLHGVTSFLYIFLVYRQLILFHLFHNFFIRL